MEQNNESFSYTYSAKQQEEVKRIRQKYAPPEENRLEQLRRLDAGVDRQGRLVSLIVGVISTLLFGVGLCCTTVWAHYFTLGIVIGILGLAGMAAAYPLYTAINKRQRKKLAPEIMKLSAELIDRQ